MTQITTISEFLLQAGTEYRVYDMARAIRQISEQTFLELESGLTKSSFPRQRHAWFGIVFWNKQLSKQHYIWFLKLPLDEQGYIVVATRNHFLQLIIEALGQQLENAESQGGQLTDNPYGFIPNQTQLANFNSISRRDLALPDSAYFQQALDYIKRPVGQDWQQLPLQGISDFAAHSRQEIYCQLLMKNLVRLQPQVRHRLLSDLENHLISDALSEFIAAYARENMTDLLELQVALRALSQSEQEAPLQTLLKALLHSPLGQHPDILTLIAARHWQHLINEVLLNIFIQNLAVIDADSSLFAPLFRDLVQIPLLREPMLQVLRRPDKDTALTLAIGKLFSAEQA
jgi:hypothetical protein